MIRCSVGRSADFEDKIEWNVWSGSWIWGFYIDSHCLDDNFFQSLVKKKWSDLAMWKLWARSFQTSPSNVLSFWSGLKLCFVRENKRRTLDIWMCGKIGFTVDQRLSVEALTFSKVIFELKINDLPIDQWWSFAAWWLFWKKILLPLDK